MMTRARGPDWSTVAAPVRALMDEHSFDGDPRELVSDLTSQLLISMCGGPPTVEDLPISIEMAASFRHAEIEYARGGPAGSVRYSNDRYLIRVDSEQPPGRRRFSCAHEVMHIPFMSASESTARTDDGVIGKFDWSRQEEFLCDHGAAELLMPESAVRSLVPPQPTMDDVVRVADSCDTSIEASMRRVVDLSGLRGCAVVLRPKLKPVEKREVERARKAPTLMPELEPVPPSPKLRVDYAIDFGIPIFTDKSVHEDSPLATAGAGEAVDFVGHTGLVDRPLAVSARHMPYWRRDEMVQRVVAVMFDATDWAEAA